MGPVKLLRLNAYVYHETFVPRFHYVLDGMIFPPFFHAVCNSYGEFLFLKFSILSLIEKFVLVQKSQIKSEEGLKK